jgi:hypothetical protein
MARINSLNLEIMNFNINEIIPTQEKVFASQGIPSASKISEKTLGVYVKSLHLFTELAHPVGMVTKVGIDEFADIYLGEGKNKIDSMLINIYPRAEHLNLYALTIGEEVSTKIELLFQENEYPMGYMLDSIASIAAEKAVEILQKKNLEKLEKENLAREDTRVLSYSPGYCGWHISGQKKLFAHLKPGRIGISLNTSYLMTPLKSVSGVLLAGSDEIYLFTPNYPFCKPCKTHSCLQRMKEINQGN